MKNPDDPRWLAAAAMHDAAVMAGIPGASVTVITYPESPQSPAQAASLDFPVGNPVARVLAADNRPLPRSAQPPSRGPTLSP